MLGTYAEYMTDEAVALSSQTAIFCADQPICNAVASLSRDGLPYVLVYSGLLDVALYRLCASILIANANLMLQRRNPDIELAQSHLKTIAFNSQALSFWYYIDGEPLPSLFDILNDAHKTQAHHGLGGALVFVVMHEIGHLKLGHVGTNTPPLPQIYSTLVAEDITMFKAMEFAADQFALSSMKEVLRPTLVSSLFIVLDLISDLECMCLPLSASHPLVVNRIDNLLAAMGLTEDDFFISRARAMLASKKTLLMERLSNFPAQPGISKPTDIKQATEIFRRSLPSRDECLKAIDTLKNLYDGNDYIGPSIASA
jgi:hypothetical protein